MNDLEKHEKPHDMPPPVEPARCRICGGKSPMDLSIGRDLRGWMGLCFPMPVDWGCQDPTEMTYLCPPCGKRVAEFVAHLQTPALDEEGLR